MVKNKINKINKIEKKMEKKIEKKTDKPVVEKKLKDKDGRKKLFDEDVAQSMLKVARAKNRYDELVEYCMPMVKYYVNVIAKLPDCASLEDFEQTCYIFLIWALQRYDGHIKLYSCINIYLGFALLTFKAAEAPFSCNSVQLLDGFDRPDSLEELENDTDTGRIRIRSICEGTD
jgi:hypothetical protein